MSLNIMQLSKLKVVIKLALYSTVYIFLVLLLIYYYLIPFYISYYEKVSLIDQKRSEVTSLESLLLKQRIPNAEVMNSDKFTKLIKSLFLNAKNMQLKSMKFLNSDQVGELYLLSYQLEFYGSYGEVLNYLKRMLDFNYQILWHSLSYKVEYYPLSLVKVNISILSPDKE